jgi:hypothetical protein
MPVEIHVLDHVGRDRAAPQVMTRFEVGHRVEELLLWRFSRWRSS